MPNHHLIDLEHLRMHTKRHTHHPKALRKIVFTRTGPISSSFNRSVLPKGAIREHTCPHLIDLVSNGVHHVLPSSSIRFGHDMPSKLTYMMIESQYTPHVVYLLSVTALTTSPKAHLETRRPQRMIISQIPNDSGSIVYVTLYI